MRDLLLDLRHALRSLLRQPGFTAVAVLTLALGIGATTSVFSVVYGVLLRPFPFPDSERLVRVYSEREGVLWTASPPDFTDWRAWSESYEELAAINARAFALTGDGPAEQRPGALVTPGFLPVLGIAPALGRGFSEGHGVPGQDKAVLLGDGLWRSRYGGDPQIVGRTIRLDGMSYEVIGVMPPGFDEPYRAELWVPLAFAADDLATQRGAHYLDVWGRLRPGVELEQATGEIRDIAARINAAYPDANPNWSARVTSLREAQVGDVEQSLLALLGAVGLVLLMTCVNVASLMLSRAATRDHEVAVRIALGIDRFRLVRGILAESLLLALAGGALGVALTTWSVEALKQLAPANLPRMDHVHVDLVVLGFALAASGLTGLVFGAAPALQLLRRRQATATLNTTTRGGTAGREAQRWRRGLVTAQIALAVTLVAGAGLLVKSFGRLMAIDPGFHTEGALTFNLSLPDSGYEEPERAADFVRRLEERLRALPGVTDVGTVMGLPLSGFNYSISVTTLDGRALTPEEEERTGAQLRFVTPDYFRTIGMTLLAGRGFEDADRAGSRMVAVVNETAARRLFGDEAPIGKHLEFGTRMGLGRGRVNGEIVGVVRDVKDVALGAPARPHVYFAHAQWPAGFLQPVLRTSGDPLTLAEPARRVVAEIDPDVPAYRVRTVASLLAASAARARFLMLVLAVFAGAGLVLAAVGIYGVVTHSVVQRTRELGIRMALGARAADILGLVLRQGALLAVIGAALGLAGALLATRSLRGLLFDVAPTDPPTLGFGTLALLVTALLASYLPARRAARANPVDALRQD